MCVFFQRALKKLIFFCSPKISAGVKFTLKTHFSWNCYFCKSFFSDLLALYFSKHRSHKFVIGTATHKKFLSYFDFQQMFLIFMLKSIWKEENFNLSFNKSEIIFCFELNKNRFPSMHCTHIKMIRCSENYNLWFIEAIKIHDFPI
jgi:hypothetical protein